MTTDDELWWVDSAAEETFGIQVGGAVLENVHPAEACAGRHCVLHNPSDHHMRGWKLNWRGDRGIMERLCPEHGVGHPDPDDVGYHVDVLGDEYAGVHGCCGCCRYPPAGAG